MTGINPDVSSIESREDLSRFLIDLAEKVESGAFPCANGGSVDYVRAAGYWVRAMHGFYMNQGEQVPASPDWSTIAQIFSAAFVYE
ncbi:DUF7660 family protein [Nocardiopsis mwathae]|uniref:DUF7660 family protein n=1 Tax=Nocardiopsis mwathae TaxID=1472723 RepID=UPI00160D32AB|nr:hypothetical protein [Nocardiopsis mwathae]